MGQICAADTGNYQPSEKWRVNGYIPNSDPVLSKGTDSFSVNYTETVMQHQGPYQQETAYATIKNTRHKFSEKNSFYYIFSDNPESKKNALLLRFYWNIRPAGIAMLINRLTAGLNRHYIPFQFKCLKHPDLYTRSDACVLYIFPKYLHITCQVIKNFIGEIQPYLKADTPMLTLRLCDGLSFAESPAGGKSFGMQHSKMLSYCLITAFEQGMSVEQKVSHIINIYNAMGYSVEEIYKNPGSIFNYTFLNKILN
ncbi:MAG: T3SS effector HopA1 family protein [Mucilaginibacter sp.]